jgi:hypothetical protein
VSLLIDGYWLPVHRADARAAALYRRHYSADKNRSRTQNSYDRELNFMGPGQCMVLLGSDCRAMFAWQRNTAQRYDGQTGICCTVFRNEGDALSSDLIREADDLAWQRWPDEPRHFTYVWDAKVRHKRDPGRCFLRAGWHVCGRNADGRLTILERTQERAA